MSKAEFPDYTSFLYRDKEARVHMTKRQLDDLLAKSSIIERFPKRPVFMVPVHGCPRYVHFAPIGAGYYEVWTEVAPAKQALSAADGKGE